VSTSRFERNTTIVQAVLLTTLLAGSLDALSAIIQFTANGNHQPARIFRYIASGIFGRPALSGGTPMVVYGVRRLARHESACRSPVPHRPAPAAALALADRRRHYGDCHWDAYLAAGQTMAAQLMDMARDYRKM
jgi:hypothetical protein